MRLRLLVNRTYRASLNYMKVKDIYSAPIIVEFGGIVVEHGYSLSNMESIEDEKDPIEW